MIVNRVLLKTVSALFLAGAAAQAHASSSRQTYFMTGAKNAKWRAASTNTMKGGEIAKTSAQREKEIQDTVKSMENDVLYAAATPIWELFIADNADLDVIHATAGYGSGEITKIKIKKIGKSGILKGTLLLPVSGHVGAAKARAWSTTDTYDIDYEDSQGNRKSLVKGAKSKDIVTLQEIAIPLEKNKFIRIYYERSGSAGSGGFPEGRILEITWDGT